MNALLFGGETFYPRGGWLDCLGVFDSAQAAIDKAREIQQAADAVYWDDYSAAKQIDWWHVVVDGQVVAEAYRDVTNGKGEQQIEWRRA